MILRDDGNFRHTPLQTSVETLVTSRIFCFILFLRLYMFTAVLSPQENIGEGILIFPYTLFIRNA